MKIANLNLNLAFLTCLALLISSCDPAQQLVFINNSDSDLDIKIVETFNSNYSMSIDDTTLIKVKRGRSDTTNLGVGNWEINSNLDSFLLRLKEVSFTSKADTTILTDKTLLDSLFRKNIRGDYKEQIVINIEQ